jgi:glycosidase
MLAEAEEPDHHIRAFDMSYAWELHHLMNMIAKGEANADTLNVYFKKQDTLYPSNAYRMVFTSNHDENSWNGTVFERMGDGVKTFAVLSATLPGMPLIYTGQEAALDKRLEFFEKDTVDWGDYPYGDFYKSLLELKHENPALWNGEFGGEMKKLKTGKDKKVYAFVRIKGENVILVTTNLSPEKQDINLKVGDYAGKYESLFRGETIELNKKEEISLLPWEYQVWVK